MRYASTSLFFLLLLCACVRQVSTPEIDTLPKAVRSIAVLPVEVIVESGSSPSPKISKVMEEGVATLEQIVAEALTANPRVRLLSEEEVDANSKSYSANSMAQTLAIGKAMGVEAVMVWGLVRYIERTGGDYSVQTPASVGFQYRLIHTESGQTLCAAFFEETQKSATDNLLAFNTLARRGFKWVPASVLLREGINKKLADCQYLDGSIGKEDEAQHVDGTGAKDLSSQPAVTQPSTLAKNLTPPAETTFLASVMSPLPKEVAAPPVIDQVAYVRAEEISRFLVEWCKAWEATAGPHGEMGRYGGFYAEDFSNTNQDRKRWLDDKMRKNRVKEWIRLRIADLQITEVMHGRLMEVSFTQEYTSSNYSERSRKTLLLRNIATSWEIVAER